MNSFGRLLRVSIFGESHGDCVGVLLDGCPAGLAISEKEMLPDLARRRGGNKGTTARKEQDMPMVKSGVFNGRTTGAPILILFENRDVDSSEYERLRFTPRPGHADMVSFQKYGGFNDYRGGGQFSGRLTVGLVAAGAIAKKLIRPAKVSASVLEIGGSGDFDAATGSAMKSNDSIGGIVECRAGNVPVGLGEPFFDSVESLLSHAVFSIPGIKAIEFGAGFKCGRMHGSEFNDEIIDASGTTRTGNSGGINGGLTNGNDIVFRVGVRPTASIPRPQRTIDIRTGKEIDISVSGRHDVCIALRVPVILEAMTALVLADLMLIEQKARRVMEGQEMERC